MAVDCCVHVLETLESVPSVKLTPVASRDRSRAGVTKSDTDLIVIGVSKYPVRRLFISQLRRVYPHVPILILRRLESDQGLEEAIRSEFIVSGEAGGVEDLEIVRSLREILPVQPCNHMQKGYDYDTVREVIRVIAENYSDPNLDLSCVAKAVPISPIQLSRVLNQQVGVSFRQLLRTTRIEEAKRMLASRQYSIKEVAARVGFTDSHYFSRSFKELTGLNASDYRTKHLIND